MICCFSCQKLTNPCSFATFSIILDTHSILPSNVFGYDDTVAVCVLAIARKPRRKTTRLILNANQITESTDEILFVKINLYTDHIDNISTFFLLI